MLMVYTQLNTTKGCQDPLGAKTCSLNEAGGVQNVTP